MRPRYDRQPEHTSLGRLAKQALSRKRKRPGGHTAGDDPIPVEPNRPNNLTGGAAAALEFDE
ncbi:hypothetical protein [uncultured Sphingomonas sp.]|uniref:hypothetical protein n=1 Tax=uncultured Sphingomonas sp. TaxID=158754 RepID=UPI0035C9DC13